MQAVDEDGKAHIQYGKVVSWDKKRKQYHIQLDIGKEIFSPILGSSDVHIVGDGESESAHIQNGNVSVSAPNSKDQANILNFESAYFRTSC